MYARTYRRWDGVTTDKRQVEAGINYAYFYSNVYATVAEAQQAVREMTAGCPDIDLLNLFNNGERIIHHFVDDNDPGWLLSICDHPSVDPNFRLLTAPWTLASAYVDRDLLGSLLRSRPHFILDLPDRLPTPLHRAYDCRKPEAARLLIARFGHLERFLALSFVSSKPRWQSGDVTAWLCYQYTKRPAMTVALCALPETRGPVVASLFYALVIFVCDGLLRLPDQLGAPNQRDEAVPRFLAIAQRLPLELQVILCCRAAGTAADAIRGATAEAAFRIVATIANVPFSSLTFETEKQ